MKKIYTILLIIFSISALNGKTISKEGKITAVTVFPRGATINKTINTWLPAGRSKIIFKNLPISINSSSLNASGESIQPLTLLGVRVKKIYIPAGGLNSQQIAMRKRIEALSMRIKKYDKEKNILAKEINFFDELRITTTSDINKSIKIRKIETTSWMKLYSFIFKQLRSKKSSLFNLRIKTDKLKKEKRRLQDKYDDMKGSNDQRHKNAIVNVSMQKAGQCSIKISYKIKRCYWIPSYNLRLNDKTKKIKITYFGTIAQKTGEDWNNVSLSLSTAAKAKYHRIPKPYPWYLSISSWPRRRSSYYKSKKSYTRGFAKGANQQSRIDDNESQLLPVMKVAKEATIQRSSIRSHGASITFNVPGKTAIKSDSSEIKKVLDVKEFPIKFSYKAVPGRSKKVFIEASFKNNTTLFFIAGKSSIFRNNEYIRKTKISSLPPNGTMKLLFGTDSAITVNKELLKRKLEPGKKNEITYKYRLTATNKKNKTIRLQLFDSLPVSRNSDIKIKLKKISLKPSSKTEKGIYLWNLDLQPGKKITIEYTLVIKYPSKKRVRGLRY